MTNVGLEAEWFPLTPVSGGSTSPFGLNSGLKTHHPEPVEGRDFQLSPLPRGEEKSPGPAVKCLTKFDIGL
jgi:hypothetical protein